MLTGLHSPFARARYTAVIPVMVTLLALVACGAGEDSSPTATLQPTAEAPAQPATNTSPNNLTPAPVLAQRLSPTPAPPSTPLPTPTNTLLPTATSTPAPMTPPVPSPTATSTPTPVSLVRVLVASASIREDNALIAEISATLSDEGRVYVEYGNEEAGWFRTRTTPSASREHIVRLVRLRASTAYEYRVFALDSNERPSQPLTGEFITNDLPEDLAAIEFVEEGSPTYELTLMDLRQVVANERNWIIAIDQDSEVVWYYGGANERIRAIRQKPDFNLLFMERNFGIREITPLGEEVNRLEKSDENGVMHHDFLVMPDDKIYYVSNITRRVRPEGPEDRDLNTLVTGLALREWDQKTNDIKVLWNWFDFIPPNEVAAALKETIDFREHGIHTNSLQVGPRGNIVVSSRNINQIISIAPDFQSVEWRLGGPGSDFTFPDPSDQFYHQHQATQLPNGNILLFDNGNTRPDDVGGEYSRGLELSLDFENMTATKVWEYRNVPDLYARSISGVERLPNGNTLVNFGRTTDSAGLPLTLVEAGLSGEVIWKFETPSPSVRMRFRAYAFDSILGETRIR